MGRWRCPTSDHLHVVRLWNLDRHKHQIGPARAVSIEFETGGISEEQARDELQETILAMLNRSK